MYPSPLRAELPEPQLRWMLLISFVLHVTLLAAFFGTPPDTSKRIYYSPVYSVSLVDAPPGPPGPPGPKTSQEQPKSNQQQQTTKLWKGPLSLETGTKVSSPRSHNIITVSKSEEFEYSPKTKKTDRSDEGPQKPSSLSRSAAGDTLQGASSGTDTEEEAPAGGGGGGGGGGTSNLIFSRYYQAIWERIQQAWILPPHDRKGKLEAIVVITIRNDGKIIGFDFERRSGDENLDNSVVRAIKKADPLPPFPPDLKESTLEVGIRFIPDEKL